MNWNEQRLKRIEDKQDEILACVNDLKTQIAVLKVKAGLWGFLSGAVATVLSSFLRGHSN